MSKSVPSHKKRIDETYCWRKPTIVDRNPELIEMLKTKPLYVDALYTRRVLASLAFAPSDAHMLPACFAAGINHRHMAK